MHQYLDLIYQYYPKDVPVSDPKYVYTEEITRHFKKANQAGANNDLFLQLTNDIEKEFNIPVCDWSLRGLFDFSYTGIFPIPEKWQIKNYTRCVYSISILARYYCVYLTQSYESGINTLEKDIYTAEEHLFINQVTNVIKNHYPEFEPIPNNAFYEEVPGVYSDRRFDKLATFFDCLITDRLV